jgi:hypothetical protein
MTRSARPPPGRPPPALLRRAVLTRRRGAPVLPLRPPLAGSVKGPPRAAARASSGLLRRGREGEPAAVRSDHSPPIR